MTENDYKQIDDWLAKPENLKKLTPLEFAQINLHLQQYRENVAPIVIRAMSREKESTFLFKL